MTNPATNAQPASTGARIDRGKPEYPVREYIGAMAQELAQMARWDSDDVLADLLEAVADRANEPRSA